MSFHEKSTAIMLGAILATYGWYFYEMVEIAWGAPVDVSPVAVASIATHLFGTVVALVVIAAVGHGAVALYEYRQNGAVEDDMDERDRLIELKGERMGGTVLGGCVLMVIGMILLGFSQFWTANALLLAMVLAEVVKSVMKLVNYRRGV